MNDNIKMSEGKTTVDPRVTRKKIKKIKIEKRKKKNNQNRNGKKKNFHWCIYIYIMAFVEIRIKSGISRESIKHGLFVLKIVIRKIAATILTGNRIFFPSNIAKKDRNKSKKKNVFSEDSKLCFFFFFKI